MQFLNYVWKPVASKTIDIVTSQNVVITYDLASPIQRIVSNILDIITVYLLHSVVTVLLSNYDSINRFFVFSIMLIWLYHLVFIVFFRGNTIGMRIQKLHILKPGGGNVDFQELLLRWIMRPLDITFTIGALAFFLIMGSEKRQRLGDMLAGTVVVRKQQQVHFSLADILEFHDNKGLESVQYPGVRHLQETDVLLIKNLIHNEPGYNRNIHVKMMDECAEKMAILLDVHDERPESAAFLKSLVNDYIVLTR